ncbi:cytochrome c oxidase assembly protein [Rubritepida flocculans]|uniref:cytochrome c oxidase assembly protein n=1 Tax=Rubritepida flocculans TaxID=182403 RepID=UPI0003F9F0F3|nr:cytochrome c oxidase assembly protein [Rubritepida flocculans]
MMLQRPDPETLARRNRRMAFGAFGFVAFMVGVSFAAVPLYDLFCRVTGFGGTPMIGQAAPGAVGEQTITVRFNANTQPNLPWRFAPQQNAVTVRLGEEGVAFYTARNLANGPVMGVSTYNVTPEVVGRYFHKTACFCFEEQTLEPGQTVDMPLAFWVDPRIATDPATRDIRTITVSYTFFRSLNDAERAGALANAGPHVGNTRVR